MKPSILYEFESEEDRKVFSIAINNLLKFGWISVNGCVGSSFPDCEAAGND